MAGNRPYAVTHRGSHNRSDAGLRILDIESGVSFYFSITLWAKQAWPRAIIF
jgi:hypothetical protein